MPAATTSTPSLVICAGSCLVTSRKTTLVPARMAPIMTVTAAATDRTMTSRTLLVVAVFERTGQRSHRGYRLASQMTSCNHYDRHFRQSQPSQRSDSVARGANAADLAFYPYERRSVPPPAVTGDTLCA
jgi:hypothetical protein